MVAVPASGASRPTTTRMVVDLPAPFGPTKPVTWPGPAVNVIPSSAWVEPNRLRSPSISILAFMAPRCRSPGRGASARGPICTVPHQPAGIRPQADDPAPHGGYARGEHDPAGWRRP